MLIRNFIRWIRNAFITFLVLIVLYFLLAVLLTIIPVNSNYKPPEKGTIIYLTSNEVHTDFVLPVNTQLKNWRIDFPDTAFGYVDSSFKYISFGWGDKEFYINTPTWADLKWNIALKALFLPTPSLMHVTYLRNKPVLSDLSKEVIITNEQYRILIDYLDNSFSKYDSNRYRVIIVPSKSSSENYYESTGNYNFINTCNNWTNKGLKLMGIRTATWAPFDKCVLYHF